MARRTITALVCAAALVAVAGCGESDQEQAREVVQDYVDARNDRQFEVVCDLFSDSYKQQFAVGDNCPAFMEEQTSGASGGELSVADVNVNDDRATADLDVSEGSEGPSRVALVLERQDGEWKITGLQ
jgi:hypothetical protein